MKNKYFNKKVEGKFLLSKKAQMSYAQILVLVCSMFAFSYMIYSIDSVSAQGHEFVCCEETSSGQSCQYVMESECKADSQKSPTSCEATSFCEPGCCFSENNGLCNLNTPKGDCETKDGVWFNDASCNIKECERGCCTLGNQAIFTTEKNCERESVFYGAPMNFKSEVSSEIGCIFFTEKSDEGACMIYSGEDVNCVYTTRQSCLDRTGSEDDFYANYFCSDVELETTCESHARTGCVKGEDEIYWFDSCGNREEIKERCSVFEGSICGQYRPGIDNEPNEGDYVCRSLDCEVEVYGERVYYENGESWCEYEGSIGEGRDVVGSRHFRHICYFGEEKIEPCSDYRNQICVQSDTSLADGSEFSEASCRVNRWRSCYEYNQEGKDMAEKCEENPDCYVHNVAVDDDFNFDICVPNYPPGFDLKSSDSLRNGEVECSLASQKCVITYIKRFTGWNCVSNCHCEDLNFAQQMNDLCTSLGDCGGYVNWVGDYTDDGYTSNVGRINGQQYRGLAEDNPGQEPAEPGDFGFAQILGIPEGLGEGEDLEEGGMLGMLGAGVSGVGWMKSVGSVGSTVSLTLTPHDVFGTTLVSTTKAGATFTQAIATTDWVHEFVLMDFNPKQISEVLGVWGGAPDVALKTASDLYGTGKTPEQIVRALKASQGVAPPSPEFMGTVVNDLAELGNKEIIFSDMPSNVEPPSKSLFKLPEWTGDALAGIGAGLSTVSFLQAGFGANEEISYTAGALVGIYVFYNPALWWVGLILTLYSWIAGLGDVKEKVKAFNCYPWQAPNGGLNCDKCNDDDIICSEYKCEILGQTCEFINKGTSDEKCVDNSPTDISSPRISPLIEAITEGYDYKDVQNNGFEIKSVDGSCVPEYEILKFGIETDKPAQCKIGYEVMQTYEEMPEFFGGRNLYLDNHTMEIPMIGPNAFKNQYNLTDEQIADLGELNFYVKCKSVNGNSNTIPYTIRTCVEPGPDITAPRVTKIFPENNYVAFNQTEKEIEVWMNEPSQCKWSNEDKGYVQMENSMECKTGLANYGLYGWVCDTTLTGLDVDDKFYIKCQDISDNGNLMTESYVYGLSLSESELKIVDIRPEDKSEIVSGFEPVSLEFKVKTDGGVENGEAVCKWEGNGYSDDFIDTGGVYHNYKITSANSGNYNVDFICEDAAGNVARNSTYFKIIVDNSGPVITRIYYSGGLKVWTNEEAECRYAFDSRVNWDNLTSMGYGVEHSADWQLKNYYIQCEDEFGNKGRVNAIKAYSLI